MSVRRWRVGLVATLVLTGVGLVFGEATLLAAAVVPLTYVSYGVLSGLSGEPQLRATRRFDPPTATPGERVTVTLHVENTGEMVLPDVRIIDRVPQLAIVEGSPRSATTLGPGETVTVSYTVVPYRGDHEFDAPLVRVRSLSASAMHTEALSVDSGGTLRCRRPSQDPYAEAVLGRIGRLAADTTGQGTEFYATREYRRGDPMRKIDWRHVAKTGEFVTVQYRDQQTRRSAVVVDVRQPNRRRPVPYHPTAAALSLDAGQRLLAAFERADGLAGAGVVGLEPDDPLSGVGGVAWASGDVGGTDPRMLLQRIRETVDGAASHGTNSDGNPVSQTATGDRAPAVAGSRTPGGARTDGGSGGSGRFGSVDDTQAPDHGTPERVDESGDVVDSAAEGVDESDGQPRYIDHLFGQLPSDVQVVLCTPAIDDWVVDFGHAATSRGHELVVVSPDVTGTDDVGSRLEHLNRRVRLQRLANLGVVIDWNSGEVVGDGRLEVT